MRHWLHRTAILTYLSVRLYLVLCFDISFLSKMNERMCIQCREVIRNRRSYSWTSREQHYTEITQIIIADLMNREVSALLYFISILYYM